MSGDEAVFLLACVVLAAVAGIAVVSMAKALRGTGAKIKPGGVVIPLPTAA